MRNEVWRRIPSATMFAISSLGRVRSFARGGDRILALRCWTPPGCDRPEAFVELRRDDPEAWGWSKRRRCVRRVCDLVREAFGI
jgi:hypothetical protein